ncbi:MAG TPA: hypothetical protein VHO24_21155 [Opitutaceae bacterium]|nr:hypothetical protein [Opitutaceae bacterium]
MASNSKSTKFSAKTTRPAQTLPLSLVVLLCSFFAGGCASSSGIPKKPWDSAAELKTLAPYLTADVMATYNSAGSIAAKTVYRDTVVYARLRAIDVTYSTFVTALAKERNIEAVATDTSVLILTGTASLIHPASTKSILAAISGGVVGVKGSIDKNLFYDKTMPVLLTQMEALRKQRLATILTGLSVPADRYSLTQALIDLEDYFQSGTVPYALMAVNAESGAASQKATKEIKELRTFSFNYGAAEDEDVSTKIRTWLLNGGTAWDPARRQELEGWLKEKNVTDAGITSFLNGPFKTQRSAFVTEKKIP